ncbi:hypothetical protein D3C85_1290730 [compost metagenome]
MEIWHDDHGSDIAVRLEGQVQGLDGQAMLGAGGNLQRAHAQAFKNLQQAKIGGRFHGDGVPGPRDRAQRQVQGLDAAVRDNDVVGRGVDPVGQSPAGQDAAKVRMPLRRHRADQHLWRLAQRAGHRLLELFHRIGLRHGRGQREVGADRMRFALRDEVRHAVVDAHVLRGVQRPVDVRFADGGNAVAPGL